jgi:hypothetical protein
MASAGILESSVLSAWDSEVEADPAVDQGGERGPLCRVEIGGHPQPCEIRAQVRRRGQEGVHRWQGN